MKKTVTNLLLQTVHKHKPGKHNLQPNEQQSSCPFNRKIKQTFVTWNVHILSSGVQPPQQNPPLPHWIQPPEHFMKKKSFLRLFFLHKLETKSTLLKCGTQYSCSRKYYYRFRILCLKVKKYNYLVLNWLKLYTKAPFFLVLLRLVAVLNRHSVYPPPRLGGGGRFSKI